MNGERFVVIVAEPGETIPVGTLRAFITNGKQGINYHRNVWHHPLFAYAKVTDFSPSIARAPTTAWSAACRSRIA